MSTSVLLNLVQANNDIYLHSPQNCCVDNMAKNLTIKFVNDIINRCTDLLKEICCANDDS